MALAHLPTSRGTLMPKGSTDETASMREQNHSLGCILASIQHPIDKLERGADAPFLSLRPFQPD